MKTRLLIIIVGLSIASIFGGLYTANVLQNIEDQKAQEQWREIREDLLSEIKKNKTDSGWIADEDNSPIWVSLPVTSHDYPWHGSKHSNYDLHFEEYKKLVKIYDPSDWQDMMLWFHYLIMRYYEDQGISVFDVKTSRDSSLKGIDVGGTPHLGATWHLKILSSDLDYFLDNGFTEQDTLCFVTDTATSGEKGSAVSLETCFPLEKLDYLGCDKSIMEHLFQYSNLLDDNFDGTFSIEDIGLPDGVSQKSFDECTDYIYEKRMTPLCLSDYDPILNKCTKRMGVK